MRQAVSLLMAAAIASGQQAPSEQTVTIPVERQQAVKAWFDASVVTLGPGDSISLVVFEEPNLSKEWRVSESGELFLPMIGRVVAAGKTVSQLEGELKERYKTFIKDPQLTLFLSQLRSRPVTVSGAVRNPGIYQIEGGVTLYQSLALAGGVEAGGSTVTLTRRKSTGPLEISGARWAKDGSEMTVDMDLKNVLRGYGEEANIELHPYDVVHVTASADRMVFVAGEVNTPGAIQLRNSSWVYVSQALAMAGGPKQTGKLDKAIIFNRGENGDPPKMSLLDVKKIMEGKAEDKRLTEGDYLFVPTKTLLPTLAVVSALLSPAYTMTFILGRN
jgi:polysaccharide export outer membrane protein